MSKILCCIAALLMINCGQYKPLAQVLPKDGDTLNYRLIGFSFPEHKKATEYLLEVYEYSPDADVDIFIKKEPVLSKTFTRNRVIETVPEFGKQYQWRITYLRKGQLIDSTGYKYLTTGYHPSADTSKMRLNVITNKILDANYYIFVDASRTLYDLQGNPVWYLPDIPGITNEHSGIRDLKISPHGTITFINQKNVYEIDYDGHVLWHGPNNGRVSGDTMEQYHHEFTRLPNGHYLVAGIKNVYKKLPEHIDTMNISQRTGRIQEKEVLRKGGKVYIKTMSDTIIEYDSTGNVIWSWIANDHFTDEDLFTPLPNNAFRTHPHLNSLHFDTDNNIIYASFRNISRIIKIDYPSGNILAGYGESYMPTEKIGGNGLFYGQHSCRVNTDGDIYLFNNNNTLTAVNDTSKDRVSSIVILKETTVPRKSIDVAWEFKCNIDTFAPGFTPGGGSVNELSKGSYLVCMSDASRNFIVDTKKKILWNVILQQYDIENGWQLNRGGYRNSAIMNDGQLHKLLFNNKRLVK